MHSVFYSIFPSARSLGFPEGCWTGRVARCSVASMLSVIVSLVQPVALTRVRAVLCAPAWWGIVPRVPKRALSGQRGSRLLRPAWAILFAMFILPLALCHVRRPVSWRVSRRSYLEPLSGLDVLWGPFLRWRLHEEQLWSGVATHAGLCGQSVLSGGDKARLRADGMGPRSASRGDAGGSAVRVQRADSSCMSSPAA